MDLKLTKFLKFLFILFVISTISWFLTLLTPLDTLLIDIPFQVGAISSIFGAVLTLWFLMEFKKMSKEDIEIIAKE